MDIPTQPIVLKMNGAQTNILPPQTKYSRYSCKFTYIINTHTYAGNNKP